MRKKRKKKQKQFHHWIPVRLIELTVYSPWNYIPHIHFRGEMKCPPLHIVLKQSSPSVNRSDISTICFDCSIHNMQN